MSKIFKNLISILLCSVLLLSTVAVGVSAADITYGDYGIFHYMINYSVDGGTLSIVGCDTSASGHIVVPDTIEGYPVSGIGGGAFMNCSGITEITIGESVQAIDSSPFAGCSNLKTINFNAVDCEGCLGDDAVPIGFGESMIGTGNYTGNNTVTTVNFGSRVSSISPLLLYGFSQLKQITIPESVTSIGEFAFLNCNSVETLTYNAVNAELENNWFCFAESAEDVGFGSKSLKTINIGENVSVLPIFEDLKYLETVNYNAVNASTDSYLLFNCSCSSVNIGENVKYIPSLCYECTGIDEITIPEGVERIAMFAFNLCNVKTVNYNAINAQIIIPDDIGVLDDLSKALYGCMFAFDSNETTMSSISSINIGTGVRVIPSGILGVLPELTNISIPASVETIEGLCFLFSQKLGAIDVDALNSSYKSVDGVLFTADGKTLVKYPEGKKSIKDYSIPEGTQTVSDYAFTGSELEVVRIPASVKHIGTGAFACGYTSLDSDYYGENGFDPAYATLSDVYYSGSEAQFNALYNPDDANEELSAAALHFLGDEPVSGTYGPLSYEISNGEVTITDCDETISGELVIPDTIEGYPVTSIGDVAFSYCSKLTETTIPDGVKSIGIGAFYGCTGLTSIVIPSSVITISANAFIGCTGLTNITIPDSVTNIGNWAFEGCTGLTSITIPNSVTSINVGTFWGCSGLTSITIPNSVTYIGSSAFSGCIGLTSVTVPSSVTTISSNAFNGCTGLTSITIPDSVTYIGNSAFSGCAGLTSITIPDSVTYIGNSAFSDCTDLTNITIPSSVTGIGPYVFAGCSALENIKVSKDNTSYHSSGNCLIAIGSKTLVAGCKNSVIPDDGSVTNIGYGAFEKCSELTSITIPEGVTSIGNSAFYCCTGLTNITIPDTVTSIGSFAFEDCSGLTNITIPSSVTSIGHYAFTGCSRLESIKVLEDNTAYHSSGNCLIETGSKTLIAGCKNSVIPDDGSVTSIGYYAFENCTDLTNITIPSSVTTISSHAFNGCTGLTSIIISEGVTSVGSYAFSGCTALARVFLPLSLSIIEEGAFEVYFVDDSAVATILYYSGSQNDWELITMFELIETGVYFNQFVDSKYIFEINNGEVTITGYIGNADGEITIPDMLGEMFVTAIGDDAFSNCSELTGITIPNSVTYIGSSAFSGCIGLTSVTVPSSVTTISSNAFNGCTGLTSITIPDSVTYIGNSAFSDCSELTGITIPNSVTYIGSSAFSGCIGLTSVTVPSSVTTISSNAFNGCTGLTSITIPNSVTNIGEYAFSGCTGLTSVTIGNSVKSIEYYAFDGCTSLNSVYYQGTQDEWDSLNIDEFGNEPLINANVYLVDGTLACNHIWEKEYIVEPTLTGNGVYSEVCSLCGKFKGYSYEYPLGETLGDEEDWIKEYNGFYYITICDASDGERKEIMVVGCSDEAGENVIIPESINGVPVTSIYGDAPMLFGINTKMKTLTISEGVTEIGDGAFLGCYNLEEIVLPDSVKVISDNAFSGCVGLKKITLGSGVRYIGDGAFATSVSEKMLNEIEEVDEFDELYNLKEFASEMAGHPIDDFDEAVDFLLESFDDDFIMQLQILQIAQYKRVYDYYKAGNLDSHLSDVYYRGTQEEWADITIDSGNDDLLNADIHFLGDEPVHTHTPVTVVIPATCTTAGSSYEICSECGEVLSEATAIPPNGHSFEEKMNKEPTCTQEGEYVWYCSVCGLIDHFEIMPKLAHMPGEWETVTEPTESAIGRAVKKCTECGEILEEKELPKLKVIKDNSTGIELVYNGDNYDNDVNINVVEVFDGKAFNIVNTKTGTATQKVYDVTLLVNGEETQPNGKIKVKIPLPEGYDAAHTFVYHVNTETGKIEKMAAIYENGFMVFETDHFSYYAVVEENPTAEVKLKVRSSVTVDYRSKVNITATASGVPVGFFVAIYDGKTLLKKGNNKKVVCTPEDGNGKPLELKADKTYTVKIIDANGNVQKDANGKDLTAKVEIKVKQGFFDKLIAFFKGLFRLLPTVEIKP